MVANLETLSEAVDLATTDRKLADKIQADLAKIKEDIALHGYSAVEVDGKIFRIAHIAEAA